MTLPRARVLVVLGVVLFWVGVFGAGAMVDGYSAREDYISSLASRGSPVAVLGVAALLASAGSHLVTSWAVVRAWRPGALTALLAGSLLLAGLATGVVASFRASCPGDPPGCGLGQGPAGDWVDVVHGMSVGVYEFFVLAAMLTVAAGTLRRTTPWPRWLGGLSAPFAVGSVLLLGQTEGAHLGGWQRAWLANNLAWLLVVAWVATRTTAAGGSPYRVGSRHQVPGDDPIGRISAGGHESGWIATGARQVRRVVGRSRK